MKRNTLFYWLCYGIVFSLIPACTKDKGVLISNIPVPAVHTDSASASNKITYSRNIKPLVNSKCALSGCHVANFPFGDFTSYGDLKIRIDNERVKLLVFDNNLMPPYGAVQLSSQELETLKTWIDDGAEQD